MASIYVSAFHSRIVAMRELSEIQKRGIRRRLAMLMQRSHERERLFCYWHGSWQDQNTLRDTVQQSGSGYCRPNAFLFLGRKISLERGKQSGPVRISQIIKELFRRANHPDAPEFPAV